MKTITMPYDEYHQELADARREGAENSKEARTMRAALRNIGSIFNGYLKEPLYGSYTKTPRTAKELCLIAREALLELGLIDSLHPKENGNPYGI